MHLDLLAIHLLSTPALVGLAHVRRGLNGRNELQSKVSDADEANNRTGNVPQHTVVQQKRSNEDIDWNRSIFQARSERTRTQLTNTTTQEGEEERRIAVSVIGDGRQEFQATKG